MSTLRDKILAIHYPQSAGQVPPCGYVLGHRHALDSAAELVGEYEAAIADLLKVSEALIENVEGVEGMAGMVDACRAAIQRVRRD